MVSYKGVTNEPKAIGDLATIALTRPLSACRLPGKYANDHSRQLDGTYRTNGRRKNAIRFV